MRRKRCEGNDVSPFAVRYSQTGKSPGAKRKAIVFHAESGRPRASGVFLPGLGPLLPWGILLAGVAVGIWLLVRAFRRPDRRRLPLRLLLTALAVAALTLAGLRPMRSRPVLPATALVLTANADGEVVDSLRRTLNPEFVFTLETPAGRKETKTGLAVPDIAYLLRRYPEVRLLHVVGDGLPTDQLGLLSGHAVVAHLNPTPEGIIELNYRFQVAEGASVPLAGIFRQEEGTRRALRLDGPDGGVTLLDHTGPGNHRFETRIPARTAGRFLFTLSLLNEQNQLLQRDTLPLWIRPSPLPRILLLNQAPSFETRYLKNWLTDLGYPIAVRSTVSRDRDLTEFSNRPPVRLRPLSSSLLAQTDLLLITGNALAALSPAERNLVRAAVRDGMGLYLLAGEELPALPAADRAFFLDFPRRGGGPAFRLPGMETDFSRSPYVLLDAPLVVPLLSSQTNQTLVALRRRGRGRVALHLPLATYSLLLEGKNEPYAQLWTGLLERTTRPVEADPVVDLPEPLLLFPHQAVELTVRTARAISPPWTVRAPDSSATGVAPAQHPLLPDQWSLRFFPRQRGWHQLDIGAPREEDAYFFIQSPTAWNSLRRARRLEANRVWAAQHPPAPAPFPLTREEPFPAGWFYLVFLLAAGGLWLEERW